MTAPPFVIYCDFDGTITQGDVTDVLLSELADPSWRLVEAEWEQGLIGSRECLARQIPLIRGGWPAIEARLRDIALEPTFPAFAAWCRANSLPLRIVSDGMDRIINVLLAREGIRVDAVYANHLVESSGQLSLAFPYPPRQLACGAGLCKCERLAEAPGAPCRVVIGDGHSDWCWAACADWVFAKSQLFAYCQAQGIACTPFTNFQEIQRALVDAWNEPARRAALFVEAGRVISSAELDA